MQLRRQIFCLSSFFAICLAINLLTFQFFITFKIDSNKFGHQVYDTTGDTFLIGSESGWQIKNDQQLYLKAIEIYKQRYKDSENVIEVGEEDWQKIDKNETDRLNAIFEERRKLMVDACQSFDQENGQNLINGGGAGLNLEMFASDSNVFLKEMAAMTFVDDRNQILLCSSKGVYSKEQFESLQLLKQIRDRSDQERAQKKQDLLDYEITGVKKELLLNKSYYQNEMEKELKIRQELMKKLGDRNQDLTGSNGLIRPLLTYPKVEIYEKLTNYRKVLVVAEPIERWFRLWRQSIVGQGQLSSSKIMANLTSYFYLMTMKPEMYKNQLETCLPCLLQYDNTIHLEQIDKEMQFVAHQLMTSGEKIVKSDLFRKLNFNDDQNQEEQVFSKHLKEQRLPSSYLEALLKMPQSIRNQIVQLFKRDFVAFGYKQSAWLFDGNGDGGDSQQLYENEDDQKWKQQQFMEWQRAMLRVTKTYELKPVPT